MSPFDGLRFFQKWQKLRALLISTTRNIFLILKIQAKAQSNKQLLSIIILTERMGDIVAAQTALPRLALSEENMVWMVRKNYSSLISFNPLLKSIIEVTSYTETVILRRIFKRTKWIDLHIDDWICPVFGIHARNPNSEGINITNYFDFGSLADVFSLIASGKKADTLPNLYTDPNFDARKFLLGAFDDPLRPLLFFHPTSDESYKSWSSQQSKAFAQWVVDECNMNIIELGLTPTLTTGGNVFLLRESISLNRQAALIAQGKLFVGVDSGFSHLANALSLPSILLIAPNAGFTSHLPWRVHKHDIVLRSDTTLASITVETVKQNVVNLLANIRS